MTDKRILAQSSEIPERVHEARNLKYGVTEVEERRLKSETRVAKVELHLFHN